MSSTTLSITGATYIEELHPATDYSSVTNPHTSNQFYKKDASGTSFQCPAAIIQFTKSSALQYKKINQVILNLALYNEAVRTYTDHLHMAPYKTDKALSEILFSTYLDKGTLGDWIDETISYTIGSSLSQVTKNLSFDVTALFKSNLVNDKFHLLIAGNDLPYAQSNGTIWGGASITRASTYLTVDYETVAQLAPTPSYPKDITLMESQSTLFSWVWNSETEAVQSGVILEYKKSTDANYTVLNLTQTAHSYTLNTQLSPGTYYWRIKGVNDINETSGYSDVATFTIIGKPAAPTINTPTNKTLTEISWITPEQYAYELRMTDENGVELYHETRATMETSFRPNMFLKGSYAVSIRIKNASDLWSDWASTSFSITASGPAAASLKVAPDGDAVRLIFTIPASVTAAIIRSDGKNEKVLAAGLTSLNLEFVDDTVASGVSYTYVVRTYVNGYTDSNARTVTVNFPGYILNTEQYGKIRLTSSDEKYMPHNERIRKDASLMTYSGREYPLLDRGEHTTIEISKRAYVSDDQKLLLDAAVRNEEKIYYRDGRGNAYAAALTEASYDGYMAEGYLTTISLARLQEQEVIFNV